jgi:hypothetical protein
LLSPDQVLVASDRQHPYGFDQITKACPWRHPQAYYLDAAIRAADTDWVWVCDIDDYPMADGLQGVDAVDAEVWQLGFARSDGETYIPQHTTAGAYLDSGRNTLVGSSIFRVAAYTGCGGYPDVALQDWALWQRLFRDGARFAFSTRPHFHYMRHPSARGETELTVAARPDHLEEMNLAFA